MIRGDIKIQRLQLQIQQPTAATLYRKSLIYIAVVLVSASSCWIYMSKRIVVIT